MSKPANGAARNAMSEFERQCYDWGWQDNEKRIIKLLEEHSHWKEMWAFGPTHFQKVLIALIKEKK